VKHAEAEELIGVREIKLHVLRTANAYDISMQLQEGHILEAAEHGGLVIRNFTTKGIAWRERLEKETGREPSTAPRLRP
jgi:hypothetical protein